jgi:hypothetical protein
MKIPCCLVWFASGALAALPVLAQPAQPKAVGVNRAAQLATTITAKTERVAADKTRISLTPKLAGAANYTLLDAAGKAVPSTVSAEGALVAVVDPKQPYVLSQRVAARQPLGADGLQFPARYVTFGTRNAVNLGGLFLRPSRVPLTWDKEAGAYAAELFVGYEFQDGSERPLPAPKTVTFFAEGSNARIQADSVTIKSSGGSGYQRVMISTNEISGETLFTARVGPEDEVKASVTVRREPGKLKLTLPSTEIAAYGVGSGTLAVSLLAHDGFPLVSEESFEVQLSSRRLKLPSTVTLPANKSTAEIEFRSTGYGSDEISAQSGSLTTSESIRLIFPIAATVGAIGGGALGGVARYFRNQRKQRNQKPLLTRRVIEGMLVGVIFVGAAWAGLVTIDFSTGILGTPFGAFVLAALSGYVGCVVLDRVTNKTFKSLNPDA